MSDKGRMELSAAQVVGGALAAASAAAAASVLGVYGTVIGAVVVSVVASVGGAVYTHSVRRGSQVIQQTRVLRVLRVKEPGAAAGEGAQTVVEDQPAPAEESAIESAGGDAEVAASEPDAGPEPAPAADRPGWRQRLAGINPKAVALTGVAVLVLSMSAVVLVEQVLLGQPISSAMGHGNGKGGNSVSRFLGDDGSSSGEEKSPTPTSSPTPSTSETSTTPTATPSKSSKAPTKRSSTTQSTTKKPTTEPTTQEPTTELPTSGSTGSQERDPRRLPAQ